MSTQPAAEILSKLDPTELRQRLAQLARESRALRVLLRAAEAAKTKQQAVGKAVQHA